MGIDSLFSQTNNYTLPKVTLPSPEAQNFLRYGEIPVDMSTGIPNINVPLFTVKSGRIQFPVSASYHASGIKVGDRASVIGLGWVLNIKGSLSITVLGSMTADTSLRPTYKTAEEFYHARDSVGNNGFNAELQFADMIMNQKESKDWQSDRYSFNLPTGLSGTFRFDFITGNLLKIPFGSYQVQKKKSIHPVYGTLVTTGFIIIDEKGDRYEFGYPPSALNQYNRQTMELLNIVSADLSDTIRFVYKTGDGNTYEQTSFGSVLELGDEAYMSNSSTYPEYAPYATLSKSTNRQTTSERILDSIITAGSVIKIGSVNDRLDMGIYPTGYRVSNIEVRNRFSGNLISSVELNHSYFGTQAAKNLRLRLDSIGIKGNNSTTYQKYKFDYENAVQLPPIPEDDPNLNPWFSEDYWGYYNNSGSYSKIPQEFITTNTFISPYTGFTVPIPYGAGTNRNPDHTYAKAGMIKSVTYPTGGKTVFEFEPNQAVDAYSYPNQPVYGGPVGGFRILQVKDYSQDGVLTGTKTYKYSPGHTRTISSDLFTYGQRIFKTVTGTFILPGGTSEQANFKTSTPHTIYTSTPFLPLTYENGPPVFYEKITEYRGDTTTNLGKTEYTYDWPEQTVYVSSDHPRFQNQFEQDKGQYTPKLLTRVDYKNSSGSYYPVKRSLNQYNSFKTKYYPTGLFMVHTTSYPYANIGFDSYSAPGYLGPYFSTLGMNYYFNVFNQNATQSVILLTKSETIIYSDDTLQQSKTTQFWKYDTISHLQPLEIKLVSSKGDTLTTKYKYPTDFTGSTVYDSMIARNIVASPVVEEHFKNSSFLYGTRTNSSFWNGTSWSSAPTNLILPQTVESKQYSQSNYETRIRYHSYDSKGNIQSVSKENDVRETYVWGYKNLYPVAKIISAAPVVPQNYITQSVLDNAVGGSDDAALRSHLNSLRSIPNSFVTTYTYKPLVGITSETDPRGRTTYYTYDAFNRLVLVRDHNFKVLKKICYNYAGQPEDCQVVVPYYNDEASQVFTRNNCAACSVGSQVTYTVPSGTYSASTIQAANQLAQNDIAANGQAYANANGSCTINSNIQITYDNVAAMASGFTVVYTGSNGTYTFSIPSSGTGVLGCIPPGTYTINISKPGNTDIYTFDVGCATYSGTSGYFKFRNVSSSTCNIVKLYGAL